MTAVLGKNVLETYTAKVIAITDGDTIKVLNASNETFVVRLDSIDCPEKKQPFRNVAKQALSDLVFDKIFEVLKTGEDRYARTLAFVEVEAINTSAEMVRLGLA